MRDTPVILLAGGKSSRMGVPKTLLTHPKFRGYWIEEQLRQLESIGPLRVTIVLGYCAQEQLHCLAHLAAVVNPKPERGPFSSLQVGIRALSPSDHAAFLLPIDVPCPDSSVWRLLDSALTQELLACVPICGSRRGHPVLLSAPLMRILKTLPPTSRLDHLLRELAPKVRSVPVTDSKIGLNANHPGEWEALTDRLS